MSDEVGLGQSYGDKWEGTGEFFGQEDRRIGVVLVTQLFSCQDFLRGATGGGRERSSLNGGTHFPFDVPAPGPIYDAGFFKMREVCLHAGDTCGDSLGFEVVADAFGT